MQRMYLSYRKEDATAIVDQLASALAGQFGRSRLIQGAAAADGNATPASVAEKVERAGIIFIVIGPAWLKQLEEQGTDHPVDLVLHEVECALVLEKKVVPLCLNGCEVPSSETLPPSCAALAEIKPFPLREDHLAADIDTLLQFVSDSAPGLPIAAGPPKQELPRQWLLAAGLLGIVFVLGGFLLTSRFWLDPPPDVVGTWHAQVDYGWGVAQPEEFNFRVTGGEISGNATYLGIRRIVEQVRVEDDELHFFTRSREYVGNRQHMLRHEYVGIVEDERIHFRMETHGGPDEREPVEFIATRAE